MTCCREFAREVHTESRSHKHIEQDKDGLWHVLGCCGGECYVLIDMKFCPFCGTKLPERGELPENVELLVPSKESKERW